MESRRISIRTNRGFSLIEIVVVLAFVALVGSFGLMVGLESYRTHGFYGDRGLLITALHRARAQAIGNICLGTGCTDGRPHGVYIETNAQNEVTAFVIFEGATYETRQSAVDERILLSSVVYRSGIASTTFSQLSGEVGAARAGDIVLYDSLGHISTTTVGTEGQVFWTH